MRQLQNPVLSRPPRQALASGLAVTAPVATVRLRVSQLPLMSNGETREREFSALESVPDQYEKIALSLDRFDFSRNGVRHAYLPDYLTELSKEE